MVDKITYKILHHIYLILLLFNDYPLEKKNVFCQGHLTSLRLEPITPERQAMIDAILLVYTPYDEGMVSKKTDKKKITTDVERIKKLKPYIIAELDDLGTKINTITHTDRNINKELGLNKPSSFYKNKNQHELLLTYKSFKLIMSLNPLFVPLMAQVNQFVKTVTDSYSVKNRKKSGVKVVVTNVELMVDPLRKALTSNFYALGAEYIDNPEIVINYFPYVDMDVRMKNKELLAINQFNGIGMQGTVVNLIDVKQDFGNWIEADCRKCTVDIYLWLAGEITSVIPKNAQKVCKGDRLIFKNSTIGSSTEKYFMVAFAEDVTVTEECKFKITIDKIKPKRKNIICPKVAVTVPVSIVAIPEAVVVTPEPIVEN
ncbi:MAG: hypothetical protein WCL51_15725 [Bacteroidota bacterium]